MLKRLNQPLSVWLTASAVIAFVVGMALAFAFTEPHPFWSTVGFMLAGTSLGVGVAVWIVQAILNERSGELIEQTKIDLLRFVGSQLALAISVVFSEAPDPLRARFDGTDIYDVWDQGVARGRVSPFSIVRALSSPPLKRSAKHVDSVPYITNYNYTLDTGQSIVNAALRMLLDSYVA